jgi:hypothetical protein
MLAIFHAAFGRVSEYCAGATRTRTSASGLTMLHTDEASIGFQMAPCSLVFGIAAAQLETGASQVPMATFLTVSPQQSTLESATVLFYSVIETLVGEQLQKQMQRTKISQIKE